MPRALRALLIVAGAYVAAQMMADVASVRIVTLFGLAVDAGTLVYPFTFTLRDLVHKIAGKQAARLLILLAAGINLIMALLFWVVGRLPADPLSGPQLEFGQALAPVWRIVIASIVAEVISEFIDTEVYQRWYNRFGSEMQWGRVLVSNAIAIPVDTVVFIAIAFLGELAGSTLAEIFWANVLLKGAVTIVSIPWIYLVQPSPLQAEPITSP